MSDSNIVIRKKRGRPRTCQTPVVSLRLEPEWQQDIDEFRRSVVSLTGAGPLPEATDRAGVLSFRLATTLLSHESSLGYSASSASSRVSDVMCIVVQSTLSSGPRTERGSSLHGRSDWLSCQTGARDWTFQPF